MLQRARLAGPLTHQVQERFVLLRQQKDRQKHFRSQDDKHKEEEEIKRFIYLIYLRGQRVHPLTARDQCVRVQHHLQSGRREDTLLQHLERGEQKSII